MNNDVICIYYSRSGKTEQAMHEISGALDCAAFSLKDEVNRGGVLGWLRCGLDAMRKRTYPINRIVTPKPLWEYRLVILGTPVWAGRCSSVMRGFLKRRGFELPDVAYVVTHGSEEPYREVFEQMDAYLKKQHVAEVSLRPGSTGYVFWRNQFLKTCADICGVELLDVEEALAAEANREAAASERPEAEHERAAQSGAEINKTEQ